MENMEVFLLSINTSDTGVQILQPYVSVFIVDNSSKFYKCSVGIALRIILTIKLSNVRI